MDVVKGRGDRVVVELVVEDTGVVSRAAVDGVTARAVSFQKRSK